MPTHDASRRVLKICLEDEQFPKRHSFTKGHRLADPAAFAAKLTILRERVPECALIVARTEALVLGRTVDEAVSRLILYAEAGADAVVIHSKAPVADDVVSVAERWQLHDLPQPLIAIPTTYPEVSSTQLGSTGFAAIILANQALRAPVSAMGAAYEQMARHGSSSTIESEISTIQQLFDLTEIEQVSATENAYSDLVDRIRELIHSRSDLHPIDRDAPASGRIEREQWGT